MARRKVKVVRIGHGLFGNPNANRIEHTIAKWTRKGFTLEKQDDEPGSCTRWGYTLMTFIRHG